MKALKKINVPWQIRVISILFLVSCTNNKMATTKPVQLITLDPGHFHAALVQKTMYEDVDSVVHVYAPEGNDLKLHLDRINAYNTRSESPTRWKEEVYTGADFFEKMIAEKKGNVVVLSGNNQKKTDYILKSLQNGLNVFADKPMVIDGKGFEQLKEAFNIAKKNNLLLYDIMTERFEITTLLQLELSMIPEIFGQLEKGSPDNPAITKESVHHFYKYVSGNILTRPGWFMDVSQQGEGIVDVMTHLVDLVQWECFPEQVIDYTKDISINTAKRWTTAMNLSEFKAITKLDSFPSYLAKNVSSDSILQVYCNGEINYTIKGVHAKTSVIWNYKALEGTGDTHYSIMRGTKANLVIRQGKEENYKPVLYIEPVSSDGSYAAILEEHFKKISTKFPGVELYKTAKGWNIKLPAQLIEGHEAHFARVMQKFLDYLKNKNMPAWEVPNMLAKYYTTTKALETATLSSSQNTIKQ
ncbi:putative oxidoreductase C-terminal domain-containing protein [Terrimonas pollutisoli]|uniref:putative oxidoreductase C-terminal domain-containing protein n=1 Tax=Terrimonas pollutisoli TaxID=3034147 RepID=UPI0023ED8C18|nr:putative oxidoreductase C-terminal domain-containing protein [Terrimonas sp. H1YJ31]